MKKLQLWKLKYALMLLFFLGALRSQAQQPFTWDNATVYFVMTDRFENGNPANDNAYGRGLDGNGNPYGGNDWGMFHGGDVKGLTNKINEGYFQEVGVNAIWMTAPYEQTHGWVGGGPNGDFVHYPYHGYYTLDWSQMDAAMGTEAEFAEFVETAHANGIRVVMDIVLNHVGYTNFQDGEEYGYGCWSDNWKGWRPAAGQNWHAYHEELVDYNCADWGNFWGADWLRHPNINGYESCQPGGGLDNCVGFLPDIKTESTAEVGLPPILVQKWTKEGTLAQKQAELDAFFNQTGLSRTAANHIIAWLTSWVRKYGVDGFRVDTAKHVELEVWNRLKQYAQEALEEWKANNPDQVMDDQDFWMTAEVWGHGKNKSPYHDNGFNSVINFNLKNDARLGRNASDLESLFSEYASVNESSDWNVLSYISSHDVTPLFPRERLHDIAPAFMLLPGGIQIFYGDEAARPEGTGADEEQNTRSDFQWNNIDQQVFSAFSKLGRFRNNHPAIGAGQHTKLADAPYTFMRDYENEALETADRVVVAIGASGTVNINVAEAFVEGDVLIDYQTGAEVTVTGGFVTVNADSEGIVLLEQKNPTPYQIRPQVTLIPDVRYSEDPIEVTISVTDKSDPNPTVYYSLDPNATTADLSVWTVYTGSFTLSESATVKTVAQNANNALSSVVSRSYHIGQIDPFTIYYWNPTCTPNIFTWDAEPTGIQPDMVWPGEPMTDQSGSGWHAYQVEALSSNVIFNDCGGQSDDLFRDRTGWYKNGTWTETCPGDCPGLNATINPSEENHPSGTVNVTIDANEAGATVYYTIDGSTPDFNSMNAPTPFSFPLTGSAGNPISICYFVAKGTEVTEVVCKPYTFEEAPEMTVYWKAPCNNATIYFWNVEGGNATTTWPGEAMTDVDGDGWYEYTLEATATNLIFSCAGANKTGDITRTGTGWYENGTWRDTPPGDEIDPTLAISPINTSFSDSLVINITVSDNADPAPRAYYAINGTVSTSSDFIVGAGSITIHETATLEVLARDASGNEATGSSTYEKIIPGEGLTVHFKKPANWSTAKVYYWNTSPASVLPVATWPGVDFTTVNGDWYTITLNGVDAANLIFNNGAGQQTGDLSRDQEGWYKDGIWYDSDPENGSTRVTIQTPGNGSWNDANVYFWNLSSGLATTWPGEKMQYIGNGQYTYNFPDDACVNVIFSTGTGQQQTADLNRCGNGSYLISEGRWTEGTLRLVSTLEVAIPTATVDVAISPNPVTNSAKLNLNLPNTQDLHIRVVGLDGRAVYDQEILLSNGQHSLNLPTQELKGGVYIYQVVGDNFKYTGKFIKK